MVLPSGLRDEIVSIPGDVLVRRTADGLLLRPPRRLAPFATATTGFRC